MALLIACLLIHHMGLPAFWYWVAALIWGIPKVFEIIDAWLSN